MSGALVVAEKMHSDLGASVASRWMNCPGSIALSRSCPKGGSSFAAEEGTAAHALAELALRRSLPCSAFVGTTVEGIEVDDEMATHTQVYVDHCRHLSTTADRFWVEHKFNLGRLNPPGPMYGTADFVAYDGATRTVHVVDLKFGQGVVVEVKHNPQLRYYGLGAVLTDELRGLPIDSVHITIVQPRALHPDGVIRTEVVSYLELIEFSSALMDAARLTQSPDAPLNPGPWCRFCPASGRCPAQRDRAQAVAQVEFDVLPLDVPPDPQAMPIAMIAEFLPKLGILEDWIGAVRGVARSHLERGEEVPGYKLVAKRGTRRWVNPDETAAYLKADGREEDEIYDRKVKSPAQIEKLIGKKNLPKDLVESVSSGLNMVPDHHPGAAVLLSAGSEFAVISAAE